MKCSGVAGVNGEDWSPVTFGPVGGGWLSLERACADLEIGRCWRAVEWLSEKRLHLVKNENIRPEKGPDKPTEKEAEEASSVQGEHAIRIR